ncbi:DNA-binding response regulator [Curtobacterium sp. MCLR17_043]|uniref:response regulator n=1 Tax=unclassified Curtobacterium TaxID=257496 RepID=UPI000D99FA7C|nr:MULTISPECIES: response regulator transcription factor [unclassified Curtobacterium]PYY49300.1 DNA-binding response regulator [Curtobacterium sp. MCLR17_043]PZF11888.1 DNA-binding response regulator [Curtobacterium sp. MCLR17_034]
MSADSVITVVVVDDESLVRSGIAMVLNASSRTSVVAAVSSPTAVNTVREYAPDVVLLDIRMPAPDGLTILRELMAEPAPPVVAMLTTFDMDEHVLEALHGGASGFLLKDTDPEQLARHVLTLAAGGVVLAPGLRPGRLFRSPNETPRPDLVSQLGKRQITVLRALARGLTNAQICTECGLTLGAVKETVSSIVFTLGVGSRVEAAIVADRAGLVPRS